MPPTDQRMVMAPLLAFAIDPRPLDAPELFFGYVPAVCHPNARRFHLVRKGVQDADHQHALGATIQARVYGGSDLLTTLSHAGVRKDNDATCS
jgi:hypothetical protein